MHAHLNSTDQEDSKNPIWLLRNGKLSMSCLSDRRLAADYVTWNSWKLVMKVQPDFGKILLVAREAPALCTFMTILSNLSKRPSFL